MHDITIEELIYISRQFTNMFGIPIRVYYGGKEVCSCFTVNFVADPISLCLDGIMKVDSEIGYYVYNENMFYGIVNTNGYSLVAGPVSEIEIANSELKKIAFQLELETEDAEIFASEMKSLSGIHLDTMIQSLIILNFSVNRTMYDISDIRIKKSEQGEIYSEMKKATIENIIKSEYEKPSEFLENNARSYLIERDIIKKVKRGDVEGLIEGATKIPAVSSGQLAPHMLRHQKNFFIRLETIVSRSAIEAGLDIDEIFSAENNYITKCEALDNPDRIKNLQYHMILDYADRVKKLRRYNGTDSRLVNQVEKYINIHISEPIKTAEIAEYLGKSRGGLTTEFKKKTGMNLSDFINKHKIAIAEELLLETDRSIISISSFLGFSSQSHFSKIFKEIKGVTPAEYRKK